MRIGVTENSPVRADLTRTTLAVLFIVGLIAACFWIVRAFVPAMIWATMIVVATWSLMLEVQSHLWGRRWLAVTVMISALVLAFVVPFSIAIATIVENAGDIADWARTASKSRLPDLPMWLSGLPVIGPRLSSGWNDIVAAGPEALASRVEPYARAIGGWLVLKLGNFGLIALQFLLTLVMCVVLYLYGERVVAGVQLFFRRVAGTRGDEIVELSGQAIRGVAFGVIVTALVQSVLGGIGLAVVGVRFVALLTALMFVLAVAQVGAAPILFVVVGWMYWEGDTAWATGLLVWSIFVSSMDNVLRPILIRRGGHLPLLLVFAGVIGGLFAFGLIGIFVGPLVLAVGYRLLEAWVLEDRSDAVT